MKQDLDFFKTSMPSSRLADFYLGFLDGCIFIDFNFDSESVLYLKRISFDGYGCCELKGDIIPMTEDDTKLFVDDHRSEGLNQELMTRVVVSTINDNAELIWKDALTEYGLLE